MGPELTGQALETLAVIGKTFNLACESEVFPCGGEYFRMHGEEWSSAAKAFCVEKADAILFGSVGVPGLELPNGDLAGLGVLFFLRQGLDLYANVRPVQLFTPLASSPYSPGQVHLQLVREATEGLYSRIGGILSRRPKTGTGGRYSHGHGKRDRTHCPIRFSIGGTSGAGGRHSSANLCG